MVDFEMQTDFYYQQGKKGLFFFFFLKEMGEGSFNEEETFQP